jgi:histidinol phosphatase-like enzyme (inositol monophosphatase family)
LKSFFESSHKIISSVTHDLEIALDAAVEAGKLTLRYFRDRSLKVITKRDKSPVTLADRNAEKLIRQTLLRAFPKDGLLGEEFGDRPSKSGRRWVIDPIDGTKSFIHGVPLYGVMIGLEEEGTMRLGVVNFPALNQIYYAEKNSGAFCNTQRIQVSAIRTLANASLSVGGEDYFLKPGKTYIDALKHKAGLVRMWSDCYGHCLVASGHLEIMIDPKMNAWDIAALVPIITEAGGKCFNADGRLSIHGGSFISANHALGTEILKAISK